jgi:hypothetical protein
MIQYRNGLIQTKEDGNPPPKIPNYIGESIYQIAINVSKIPKYSGYTIQYKQEMISDAVLDCVAAVDNFDPAKSKYPFAYFTRIVIHAFWRRIMKEKKQQYIKLKNLERMNVYGICSDEESTLFKVNEISSDIIKSYEEKHLKKKEK